MDSRIMRSVLLFSRAFVFLLFVSCGADRGVLYDEQDVQPARDEFSVMTFNLHQYALEDRDGGGQEDDPKPEAEISALMEVIAAARPDVLAVQEMGSPPVFEEFRTRLARAGLSYEHTEYQRRGEHDNNMAVLSRFPIVSRRPHMDDNYSIGDIKVTVIRGFLDVDIEVNPRYRFRLMTAHLKARVFHQLGQTEMRRNEARLLNKHVRHALADNPDLNLLVVGDMNDTYQSAALREVMGPRERVLFDLRPADFLGDVWTHFNRGGDEYARIDYMLVSAGMMQEVVGEKTHAVRHPMCSAASDHRPLVAVFRARDISSNP